MEAETTGRNISCSEKYKETPLSPKGLEETELHQFYLEKIADFSALFS